MDNQRVRAFYFKNMTTEEKARAYDEALDRMKHVVVVPENEKALRALKETIFPELAESEDERIRKEIQKFLRDNCGAGQEAYTKCEEWCYWLEKQKEFSEHGYGLYYYHNGGFTFVARPAEEEKQKEQSLRDFIDDFPYSDEQKEQKPAEKQDYSSLNDLERAIHRCFLSAGVENVPVTIIKETAKECKRTQTIANENAGEDER